MARAPTLQGRVARTAGAAALAGALLVACVGWLLGWRLALANEDRRLTDALHTMTLEIDEGGSSDDAVDHEVAGEHGELAVLGIQVAVARRGAAMPGVPRAQGAWSGCRTIESRVRVRRCAMQHREYRITAEAPMASLRATNTTYALALGLALVPVLALAAWASRRAAAVAIEPLRELTHAVEQVRPDAPDAGVVSAEPSCAEVDALRGRFAQLLASLGESLGQARRFGSNAAHEMRTPLTTLRAELDLLAERPHDDATTRSIERLREAARALTWRLDRILLLASSSRAPRPVEAVSVDAAVRDVIASLAPDASARVHVEGDDEGLIAGDAGLIEMLARNAIDNALAFSDGLVRVRVASASERVELHIEDEGVGIAPDVRERVFEPFFRVPATSTRAPGGMGLGLALIARIAQLHEGRARFVDAARGAHLIVTFPAFRERARGAGAG